MQPELVVRRLGTEDALQYKKLRLLGLKVAPAAFGSDFEESNAYPDANWREALEGNRLHFGAFVDGRLVGIANYEILPGKKLKHRGYIYGVFVHPEFARMGVTSVVLNRIINEAGTSGVTQLHLCVGSDNEPACRLYSKLGFETYGREPSAIRLEDRDVDELLMIKFLA